MDGVNKRRDVLMEEEIKANVDRASRSADFRTHLANERTFLAWCRTSISLVMFGFVVERLDVILRVDGAAARAAAISPELYMVSLFAFAPAGVIIVVSGWHFMAVRRMIRRSEISATVFPEALVLISMIAIIAVVIILLVR